MVHRLLDAVYSHVILCLPKIFRVSLHLLLVLLLILQVIHLFLAKLVQVDDRFDDRDRRRGDGIEVLDHFPFAQAVSEDSQALDHFLTIWQVEVGDGHVHVA